MGICTNPWKIRSKFIYFGFDFPWYPRKAWAVLSLQKETCHFLCDNPSFTRKLYVPDKLSPRIQGLGWSFPRDNINKLKENEMIKSSLLFTHVPYYENFFFFYFLLVCNILLSLPLSAHSER